MQCPLKLQKHIGEDVKRNSRTTSDISGASKIYESTATISFNRCVREAVEDRTVYSPIEIENVTRTQGIPKEPDSTAVEHNLSSDGAPSLGVKYYMQLENPQLQKKTVI